jgi:P27 family predicted phage terminase small subunit
MPRERKPLEHHALQATEPSYVEQPDEMAAPGRPKYPKGITPEAKKVFKSLCGLLERRRALTEGDAELLRLYVILYQRHQKALAKIEEQGAVCVYTRLDSNGEAHDVEKANLWLKIAENCEARMTSLLDRLGLTPLNRGKVPATKAPKETKAPDAMEELMNRPRTATPEPEINLAEIDEDSAVQ